MSDIVGIDLGTTNSLIGMMEAGFPILLALGLGAFAYHGQEHDDEGPRHQSERDGHPAASPSASAC